MCANKLRSVLKNMCQLKLNRLLWTFTLLTIIYVALSKYLNRNKPVIVWWTEGFPGEKNTEIDCREHSCVVTTEKLQNIDAYLFYGSNLNFENLPLPRTIKTIWGLFHEESPRNVEALMHENGLNVFNYSSTFSRYSNVPFVLQYLQDINDLKNERHFTPTNEKNKLLGEISPVLYIQSDCETMTERDEYVTEFMKYFEVDSYGKCLNNKQLPDKFKVDYLNNLDEDEFLDFVSRYKFTFAIENGVCDDYITEKLWRPLKVGSVPLYYGSPTVSDWLPNEKSAILLDKYRNPKDLADYLNILMKNDTLYEEHLVHKIKNKIENERIINEFNSRPYTSQTFDVVREFECFICDKLHGNLETPSVVDTRHYNCPEPRSLLLGNRNDNSWIYSWNFARKQADKLYNDVLNAML